MRRRRRKHEQFNLFPLRGPNESPLKLSELGENLNSNSGGASRHSALTRKPLLPLPRAGRRRFKSGSSTRRERQESGDCIASPATTGAGRPPTGSSSRRHHHQWRSSSASTPLTIQRNFIGLIVWLSLACLPFAACASQDLDDTIHRANRSAKASAIGGETITLNTKHGHFRGLVLEEGEQRNWFSPGDKQKVVAFLGLRYASAPVKRLRFMPPTPYRYAANQLHDATRFGPICPQRFPIDGDTSGFQNEINSSSSSASLPLQLATGEESRINLLAKTMPSASFQYLRPLFRRLMSKEQSEDCLNLNIYVPSAQVLHQQQQSVAASALGPSKLLPVLVIIHGESFDYGAGSAYDGHKLLLAEANMLVVTFNFRLNIFGFLPKLFGASRGNLGLMDQIAALHWIKDNIGSFGGSAQNITLMGTKRGAIFVNLLMLSPMAKGLFHRAILEDGSALSALTANQVAAPSYQHHSVQHLRILAKLCDCPTSSAKLAAENNLQAAGVGAAASTTSLLPDEQAKANAQLLDCLRYKPVDQLMQRVPLELLQLDQQHELIIQPRWQSKVRPYLAANNSSPIKSEHLTQLLRQVIAAQSYHSGAASSSSSSELFEAIYGHNHQLAASVRPLFGPVIDGSIVPDEDFASSMLKDDSILANKDLLIGLTHPVLLAQGFKHAEDDGSTAAAQLNRTATTTTTTTLSILDASNYLAERILASQEQQGLSNERAVSLVNAFVKSFYRYHQQEIANSILNHYLSLQAASSIVWQAGPETKQQQSDLSLRTAGDEDESSVVVAAKLQRRRQEFLLRSISRLFQDSLTDVPLFKLALVHSVKQMDSLLSVFADTLFDQWRADERHLGGEQDNFPSSAADLERKYLLDSFTGFARHHLDRPIESLPLEWRQLPVGPQLRGTFLYQFDDQLNLGSRVRTAIERLRAGEKATEQATIWLLVNPILEKLDVKLEASSPARRGSLECGHYPSERQDDEEDHLNIDRMIARLEDWLCLTTTGSKLMGFVAAGDVNYAPTISSSGQGRVNEYLADFESTCSLASQRKDHHLVQPSDGGLDADRALPGRCKKQLSDLVVAILINELDDAMKTHQTRWSSFNVFSQQIATLSDAANPLKMNRISEFGSEPTSLMAKSNFWSNFIPALNCNKTQPINPLTLLEGSFNSSLRNLNIQFTCQHGSRTAQDYIESIVFVASQRLQSRKNQWRNQSRLSSMQSNTSVQNHHSLRMANMSQSGAADDGLDSTATEDHNTNVSLSLPSLHEGDLITLGTTGAAALRSSKATGIVLILCALVVCLTLISGTYVALRQRHSRRKEAKKQKQQLPNGSQVELNPTTTILECNHLSGAEDGRQQQQQQAEITASPDGNKTHVVSSTEWLPDDATNEIMLAQLPDLNQELVHQQSTSSYNGLAAGQCRSHSALSLASQLHSTSDSFVNPLDAYNALALDQFGAYGLELGQEPIVLPILSSNHQQQQQQQQQFRCQTLDTRRYRNHLMDQSSTDTQNGRSSQSSAATGTTTTTKKRVKINEPQSIMKQSARVRQYDDIYNQQQTTYQPSETRVQLCPIHSRSQSSQYLSGPQQTDGYLLSDGQSEYLTINNPGSWASAQQSLATNYNNNNNCDHIS